MVDLPESFSYRLKRKLLGKPLVTERLSEERLSNVIALGVLAPDCISSTAYGTEEILAELVPAVGVAAFALLLPITFAVIAVLIFVTLSYREVVMAYTKAGGAYVVARENFGPRIAQIAAVALIIDYIVTVAVQTAAGTDAVTSAFPSLTHWHLEITIAVVVLLYYGNLRGIREAGKMFALPTYLFIGAVGSLIGIGAIRALLGQLHHHAIPLGAHGVGYHVGHPGSGLLLGAGLIVVMRGFANGGSSLTGLEAISNGVANFRPPEGRNARKTLVTMSFVLGTLVVGVSFLAWQTHAVPFSGGSPTVLSQEAKYVFGGGPLGNFGYYAVQGVTMLILYTGANTSFNGFPNLASFVAMDSFLPRQLLKRGHRLAFSNGITVLAAVSIVLLVVTDANVTRLVSIYAIGVFTGFTMAGAGMVRHHLVGRSHGYRRRIFINGFAALLSGIVVLIFAIAKFTEGAWVVVVLFPLLAAVLIRFHHVYSAEEGELEANVQNVVVAPILPRHSVLVFVERFDLAAARALQYARSLSPDEPRVIHFVLDTAAARELEQLWVRLGISSVSLELIECPDRRLGRAALELVVETAADGETEVTVLLPRRVYNGSARWLMHDRTSERIAGLVSEIPNASATIIPFYLGTRRRAISFPPAPSAAEITGRRGAEASQPLVFSDELQRLLSTTAPAGTTPIGQVTVRSRAQVAGRVHSVRVQPGMGRSSLEVTLVDDTGRILLLFQGRRLLPGVEPGARLAVEGMVGLRGRRLTMTNPAYTLLPPPDR
jgi:amino acid transporter